MRERRTGRLLVWLAVACTVPLFVSMVTQGFLGFGFAMSLPVLALVAVQSARRRYLVVGVPILLYAALSLYVTYMTYRRELRAAVWGGRTVAERVDVMAAIGSNWEWLDVQDHEHLYRVDQRMNQNYLLGVAVMRLERGRVDFARGATIGDAAMALVPRALWPEKPVSVGSGDLVTRFTGIRFARGTSVGIGHVMELYVNFATLGLCVGFALLGATICAVDFAAARRLKAGNVSGFLLWYLPALPLLSVGDSLVALTSGAAAGVVVAWMVGRWIDRSATVAAPATA
jgi:hypothetical protein